jgi:hypothetical protein
LIAIEHEIDLTYQFQRSSSVQSVRRENGQAKSMYDININIRNVCCLTVHFYRTGYNYVRIGVVVANHSGAVVKRREGTAGFNVSDVCDSYCEL